jgi:hypothetical protein
VGRSRKRKTAEGHRRVFTALEGFLRDRYGLLSLASTTFDDVTRRMAGDFITGARGKSAPVRREFPPPWACGVGPSAGATEANPDGPDGGLVSPEASPMTEPSGPSQSPSWSPDPRRGSDWSPNGAVKGHPWDASVS